MRKDPKSNIKEELSLEDASLSSEDPQIKSYVEEFKREIEEKFKRSKMNHTYAFPRKPKSRSHKLQRGDSFESLKDVLFYDLESQNVKHRLATAISQRKKSISEDIVEIIKSLGKLDGRYLKSQFSSVRSPFFKLLHTSLSEKLEQQGSTALGKNFLLAEFRPNSNRSTLKAEKKAFHTTELPVQVSQECRLPPSSYYPKPRQKTARPPHPSPAPYAHNLSYNVPASKRSRLVSAVYDQNKTSLNAKTLKTASTVAAAKRNGFTSQLNIEAERKKGAQQLACRTQSSAVSKKPTSSAQLGKRDAAPFSILPGRYSPKFLRTVVKDPKQRRENFNKFLTKESTKNC